MYTYTHTHIHTRTHIYIYIYVYLNALRAVRHRAAFPWCVGFMCIRESAIASFISNGCHCCMIEFYSPWLQMCYEDVATFEAFREACLTRPL